MTFLGHVECIECKDAAYCYRCSAVCVRVPVYLSDIIMRCAKTDKPIEMPFGVWTCAGPINHVLSRGLDTHRNMEFFFGGGRPCDVSFHRNSSITCLTPAHSLIFLPHLVARLTRVQKGWAYWTIEERDSLSFRDTLCGNHNKAKKYSNLPYQDLWRQMKRSVNIRLYSRGGSRGWLGWLVTPPWRGSLFNVIIMRLSNFIHF